MAAVSTAWANCTPSPCRRTGNLPPRKKEKDPGEMILPLVNSITSPQPAKISKILIGDSRCRDRRGGFEPLSRIGRLRIGYGIDLDKIISPGSNGPCFSRRNLPGSHPLADKTGKSLAARTPGPWCRASAIGGCQSATRRQTGRAVGQSPNAGWARYSRPHVLLLP